jgi:hypothetical protein
VASTLRRTTLARPVAGLGLQRQQRHRPVPGEALVGGARPVVGLQQHVADPGGLAVVVAQGLAGLVGEHAALGDHRQLETLGNAGVQLDTTGHRLDRRHRLPKAETAARGGGVALGLPGPLQRRHQLAVSQHRAELRHRLVLGLEQQLRPDGPAGQRWRRLRHMHLHDGLRHVGRPHAQALQQLHAAQAERDGAWVARHVLARRAGVEQGDLGFGPQARGEQGQRQAHRAGTDDGQTAGGWGRLGGHVQGCGGRRSGRSSVRHGGPCRAGG